MLQQALSLNPNITIMATPWSPPGWMKTSGSMIGGSLNSGDYQVFADYLTKFLQAYDAAGVPVSLITPQNEPEYSPSNYPGSTLTAAQEASFIGSNLGPDLQKAGLSTKIIAYDHNWNDTSFPETVLGNSTAGQYTAGVAWHCYAGDPSAQTTVHNAYPGKDTYFTECSGSQSANPANTFADSLDWQTENLIIGATRNWAKTVATWNMALNPSGGPSMNCTTCTGVVTVDNSAGTATYNAEYYVLGQASKFVKPGAVRIDSNTFGSGNLEDVAFQNPDGSDALIALNADTSNAHTFNVDENGQYFTYTLPARAVATFTWTPGSTSTGGGGISSSTWYQVVNTNSGDCVDDTNGSTANGTAVQQWACAAGNANQEWQFQPTSGGYYQVVTRNDPARPGTSPAGRPPPATAPRSSCGPLPAAPTSSGCPRCNPTAATPSPPATAATNAWTSPTARPPTARSSSSGPAPPVTPPRHSGSSRSLERRLESHAGTSWTSPATWATPAVHAAFGKPARGRRSRRRGSARPD